MAEAGREVVTPSPDRQSDLMDVVYRVKAGTAGPMQSARLEALALELAAAGATTVIAGCTEVSILLHDLDGLAVLDPAQVLAEATVACARGLAG